MTRALVDHPPVVPSFAYRFDTADRSIVISGDTKPSEQLVRLARGADILVHEALYPECVDRLVAGVPNAPALKQSIVSHHISAEGGIAAAAGVKTFVLSHLVPPDDPAITAQMWIDAARRTFKGQVVVGRTCWNLASITAALPSQVSNRSVMRVMRLLIGVTLTVVAPAIDAWACSCGPYGPPCQNAFQVDAVFMGTVARITPVPDGFRIPHGVRVDFTAVVAFRGLQSPIASVVTAGSGPACGYTFKEGERYLVYARRAADGIGLTTNICSRTRRLADAGDDLRFLRTLSDASDTRPRVSGTITHTEWDLAGAAREYGPVSDVLVTARGLGSAFDTWTDAQGRYELAVPPGKYEVTVVPPAGLHTPARGQPIEVPDARACFVADFGVVFDGRISGSVRDSSGEPAEGVTVELMLEKTLGTTRHVRTLHASSDAGGRFEFGPLPPGRYVVGVGLTRRSTSEVLYPPTFHPGTADPESATVVGLAAGQHFDLESMTLLPPKRPFRLTGTVVFADGTAASGAVISLWDGRALWRQVAAGITTEADGTFSFVVHDGLSYVANASHSNDSTGKRFGARVGPFVVTEDTAPIRIVLSERR